MSDLSLDEAWFKNFMSFGAIPTIIDLSAPGTTFIGGENLDDGGSSGAGKSTLINVVCYAFFDKIPNGVSKDRLINQTNDKKNTSMEVRFKFRANNHNYVIFRSRGANGGIKLLEDDKDITPASVVAFNQKIEDIIGISYNLFSQVILFNGNSKPFLDLSVGEQRVLIEELFRVTTLSRKANAGKKRVAQTDKDISLQKLLIQQQIKQNEGFRRRLIEAHERADRWTVQKDATIEKLTAQIQALSEIDFDSEESLLNEIETLKSAVSPTQNAIAVQQTQLKSKRAEKFSKKTELALLEAGIIKKNNDQKKIISELSHLADAKCPYCLQKYEDSQSKILELETKKAASEAEIIIDNEKILALKQAEQEFDRELISAANAIETEIKEKQAEIEETLNAIAEIKSVMTYASIKDLLAAKNEITTIHDKLESLLNEVNPHVESIVTLEKEGEVVVDNENLEKLLKLQEHQQFLVKLLMDKNSFIRKNIISKTIPFLNKRIGYYTDKLNLSHLVMFQPDMSCEISRHGRGLDHGNLSNGEKKRLNLSLCLAFRDVLSYLRSRVNVLFTDEIDGGSLDSNCVDSLISLLKQKAWDDDLGIFIISHRPEFDGRCDRSLIVRKERGFSTIIVQPDE